jgi:hypothetical protein
MSAEAVQRVSERRAFQPRTKFAYLASDHVRMDQLTGRLQYETRVLSAVIREPVCAAVIGPIGSGKSSLIADVCAHLPDTHIALRVPIVGVDDPTSTSAMAAMALSSALAAIDLEAHQRHALEQARADSMVAARKPTGFGGKLGGGPIPAEVHVELGTLQTELATNRLAGERLAGIDRLVSILVARELQPIFVLEDTEAAVGGGDRSDVIEGFFNGPVTAFVREVDAACLLAVQHHIAEQEPFRRLAPSLVRVELPRFDEGSAAPALATILRHRLALEDLRVDTSDLLDDGALDLLADFYGETGGLRHTLAAAQTAADHAADTGAEMIGSGHVRAAVSEWRSG